MVHHLLEVQWRFQPIMVVQISPKVMASQVVVVHRLGVVVLRFVVVASLVEVAVVQDVITLLARFFIVRVIMPLIVSSAMAILLLNRLIWRVFNIGCSVGPFTPSDWYLDTGTTTHMTNIAKILSFHPVTLDTTRSLLIMVLNFLFLVLVHKFCLIMSLLDVLVVPHTTKNLLFINKLTSDYPINVLLTANSFEI